MSRKEKNSFYYDNLMKNEWNDVAQFGPSIRTRYRIVSRLINKRLNSGVRVHECGCGTGDFLNLLQKSGDKYELSGSDFSQEAVEIAKRKTGLRIFKADITKRNSIGKEKYDAVACFEVLEHINNDKEALRNLYNSLVENGLLFVSVPYLMKHWSNSDSFSGHVRRYEPNELEQKVEEVGFTLVESFGWGNLFYRIYHEFIKKNDPQKVMSDDKVVIKKIVSKLLYYIFYFDDYFTSPNKGRRLFLIARK